MQFILESDNIFKAAIIIIMSCRQHVYPWPSLATSPYHSSPLAGLQGYILCPHIVAVCKFVLVVLLLHIHIGGPLEYIAYELVLASPAVKWFNFLYFFVGQHLRTFWLSIAFQTTVLIYLSIYLFFGFCHFRLSSLASYVIGLKATTYLDLWHVTCYSCGHWYGYLCLQLFVPDYVAGFRHGAMSSA